MDCRQEILRKNALYRESEQVGALSRIYSKQTNKQCIPVVIAWQLNERIYGELQGHNKQEIADRYGKKQVHEWRRSYDIPFPNGESLEMCAERVVAYFKENIEPQLAGGKNIMIDAHGNSLRSIIMHIDKLRSQEVISLELSTGIPMLYIFKEGKFILTAAPTEAGVYAYTKVQMYGKKPHVSQNSVNSEVLTSSTSSRKEFTGERLVDASIRWVNYEEEKW